MNVIAFRFAPTPLDYVTKIEIWIDGEYLVDMVRRVELPFAEAEGHSGIAGGYTALPACVYAPPSRHFWGEAESSRRDGKVELLTCQACGEIGCWPLLARIEAGPSQVVWSGFEQPHRRGRGTIPAWRYDGFGPFVFSRKQYEEALQAMTMKADFADPPGQE